MRKHLGASHDLFKEAASAEAVVVAAPSMILKKESEELRRISLLTSPRIAHLHVVNRGLSVASAKYPYMSYGGLFTAMAIPAATATAHLDLTLYIITIFS